MRKEHNYIIHLDVSELTGVTFENYELSETVRTSWHKVPISHDVETKEPSRRRSTSSMYTNHYIIRKYPEENRVYRPSLRCSSFFRKRRHCTRTKACLEPHYFQHRLSTHLFQTVDNKSVIFHNGFDLSSQRT